MHASVMLGGGDSVLAGVSRVPLSADEGRRQCTFSGTEDNPREPRRAFVDVRRSLEFPKPQCSQIELAAEVALHDAWLDKEVDGGG